VVEWRANPESLVAKPVLVVGAGPVGLTMAAELARYRVPVRIVDMAPVRSDKSKALAVWPRTLELLERAGCAGAFAATGLKTGAANILAGSQRIVRITFEAVASPFPYLLIIPQSETERLLAAQLEALGGRIERGVRLTGFADSGGSVSCAVRHANGTAETIDASWLIGCDGAHSTVRGTLAMPFDGDTLASNFVLADVHAAGFPMPGTELAIFWHQDGLVACFPIATDRYRIIADVGTGPRLDPTFEEIQAIVARRIPGDVRLSDPVWLSGFGVNERKVRDYRAGRVFVAGDAAHIHSPAGGQGMNTGMQDAFNLAWKLALVEHGLACPELLDSYSVERSAVAKQVLSDSGRLTRVAMVKNPAAQDLRDYVAHRIFGFSGVRHAVADRLAEITVGYPDSPLNAGAAKGKGPGPGERIVAGRPFGAGDSPRFALMARDDQQARVVLREYAAVMEPDLRPPPDAAGIWLVRPDGYVAAAARTGEWQAVRDALAKIVPSAAQAS
jgi:2-polyprenyl-6-methoxyphenol hydroxylase-like FAD-dependent oxidoreductase